MNLSQNQIMVIGIVFVVVAVFVLGFMGIIPGIKKDEGGDPNYPTASASIQMWGVGDEPQYFTELYKNYQGQHKNVKITYTKFNSPAEYEKELVEAMAEGKGPDIFMIQNSWLVEHQGKIYPSSIAPQTFQQLYPDVMYKEMVVDGKVYAMPLYSDSLALFYNKDLFNTAGIVYPPQTWDDVVAILPQVRQMDAAKKIQTAAIALGGARNVQNIADVLSTLMLQSGSAISNKQGGVRFDGSAQSALGFYLQFSNPISPYYTWNESLASSRAAFAAGKVAMIVDYRNALKDLKEKNAFLPVGIASLPQITVANPANYAQYTALTVSKQMNATKAYIAWDIVKFLTANEQANGAYLKSADKLPALRSLINKQLNSDDAPFLRGVLIAKAWHQYDASATPGIFSTMILDVLSGKVDAGQALRSAENELNRLR